MRRLATVLAFLVPFVAPALAAGYPVACRDGVYLVEGSPLLPSEAANARDAVVVAQGTVAVRSGCPAVPARIRGLRNGGVALVAKWRACGAAERVRLLARIVPGCARMEGRFYVGRPALKRVFTALGCADANTCPPIPCRANGDCSNTDYCAKRDGECGGEGVCRTRPGACPDVSDPVCGCDGVTYGNACEAATAGVNVARPGACEVCGGIRGLPCDEGAFCELPTGTCDWADLEGTCVAVPAACPDVYAPVCGCDGVTYGNDCERRSAKAQKAYDGACEPDCDVTRPCRAGQFCELPSGVCASALDAGRCVDVSVACPTIWEPVCGCDGVTYGNDCERRGAKISKSHDGPCDAKCETHCDCYGNAALPFRDPCPLACPICGNYWTCEQGLCVEHCGSIPPQPPCP